jgi:hypothetical protein
MSRFTALQDFASPETGSVYTKGMSYTIRSPQEIAARSAGKPEKAVKAALERGARLAELVPQWVAAGKVARGGPEAQVSGQAAQGGAEGGEG